MKLHLHPSLRAALIACVCTCAAVAGQSLAADVTLTDATELSPNTAGNYELSSGYNYILTSTSCDGNHGARLNGEDGTFGLTFNQETDTETGEVTVGSLTLTFLAPQNTGQTVIKKGNGELVVTGRAQEGAPENAVVESGTLKISYGGGNGFVNGTVTVKNGATLQLSGQDDALGYLDGGNYVDTLTLEAGSTLLLDKRQTLSTNVNMADAAITKGENGGMFEFFGGTLTATGTSTMSANMKASTNNQHAMKVNVTNAEDTLTFTGAIQNNGNNRLEKGGEGTLVIGNGATMGNNVTLYVNDGTVDISIGGGNAFTTGKIVVNAGGELKLSAHDALGYYENASIATITLDGEAGSVATMTVDDQQTMRTNLVLKGDTHVTGESEIRTWHGSITATGSNNVIDTHLKVQQALTIDTTNEEDELTITRLERYTSNTVTKTGAGTLILNDPSAEPAALNLVNAGYTPDGTSGVSLAISEGVLDLSNVTTLKAENFNLADGTTVILGKNTKLELTGSLTIGNNVTFDVSSWCSYEEYTPYELITYTGTGSFTTTLPEHVIISTSTGDNVNATLEFSGSSSIMLVPEPTTATLSLLALAGLCARRRRK